MGLSEDANTEIGRLLNNANNPQHPAIGHLASAAGRAVESLIYLADIDDRRFGGLWVADGYGNDAVDDGHVRWATSTALTSLDLCIAAASRLGGFAQSPSPREDCIRTYYCEDGTGRIIKDKRNLISSQWKGWIDAVVMDSRYNRLLLVRNTLVHTDALRIVHGTTGPISGHLMRYGYNIGLLTSPAHTSTRITLMARDIVLLSREVAIDHVGAFVAVLQSLP